MNSIGGQHSQRKYTVGVCLLSLEEYDKFATKVRLSFLQYHQNDLMLLQRSSPDKGNRQQVNHDLVSLLSLQDLYPCYNVLLSRILLYKLMMRLDAVLTVPIGCSKWYHMHLTLLQVRCGSHPHRQRVLQLEMFVVFFIKRLFWVCYQLLFRFLRTKNAGSDLLALRP